MRNAAGSTVAAVAAVAGTPKESAMASRDDLLDAAALIAAVAHRDQEAVDVLLDHCDLRPVAATLAHWVAGWLLDCAEMGNRDEAWWLAELRKWADGDAGDTNHPWAVQ